MSHFTHRSFSFSNSSTILDAKSISRNLLSSTIDLHSSLPEKPDFALTPRETLPFPTPHACLRASEQDLRSAGLSGAKVKYVLDISRRFAEGTLDVRRLVTLGEEEIIKELVEIKGVGPWTAQMLLMFALR